MPVDWIISVLAKVRARFGCQLIRHLATIAAYSTGPSADPLLKYYYSVYLS